MTWGFNDKVNGRKMHNRYGPLNTPVQICQTSDMNGPTKAYHSKPKGQAVPVLQQVSVQSLAKQDHEKPKENLGKLAGSRVLANKTSATTNSAYATWGFNDRVNGRRMHRQCAGLQPLAPGPSALNGQMNTYHGVPIPVPQQVSANSSNSSAPVTASSTWGFKDRVNGRKMHNRPTPTSAAMSKTQDVNGHMNAYHGVPIPVPQKVSAISGVASVPAIGNTSWGFNDRVNGRRMHNWTRQTPTFVPMTQTHDINGHMNVYHGQSVPVLQQVSVTPQRSQEAKKLKENQPSRVHAHKTSADGSEEYEIAEYGYGKNHVKLLHVERSGALHTIREYEVNTHLKLCSKKDYLEGNNKDIIATDTQKNTVYILAKKHGVKSPEEFGMLLCSHFLYVYPHVLEASVDIEEYPWERLEADDQPHNHAFVFSPSAYRFCKVSQKRHESPKIRGGLKGLRVLKTTQSAFRDFVQDEYRTLPDSNDRIFSTVVTASWDYSTATGVNFDEAWQIVKDCILDKFAGPPDTGLFSPSVQNTLYLAEKQILDRIKQIEKIEMAMPNKHYVTLDMSVFPSSVVKGENKEVYQPIDKPAGNIHAELKRKDILSKL